MSERLNSAAVAEKAIVHADLPALRGSAQQLFDQPSLGLAEALGGRDREANVAAALPNIRQDVDRTFEMPTALYGATVALYLGFIAVLGIGLATPGLALPMAIFAIFIVGLFAAPALWLGLGRKPEAKAMSYGDLMRHGIMTHTGLLKGRDAAIQMMILPVLIMVWAMTVLVIAGVVAA
ncbi:hypothetical protein [Alteriqipengyuania lutimaris]|uniref:Uncharacterized protein n=1 Tax=Alteriqipengyuania lutimaris TaxID=1538146 RepID=A0A395LNK3_9SPHN|nr:hypothetical protein [Alteriqipengyuania lutimaris]MBB3033186.1 hypothetical protein [Alteriqipengyuania lutimaris]RDS78628.1 hypothetical protein DL238_09200 [Alteriqipengyuania lutimaris]